MNSSRSGVAFSYIVQWKLASLFFPFICESIDAIFVISISLPYTYSISQQNISKIAHFPYVFREQSVGRKIGYLSHWTPWFIESLTKTKWTSERERAKKIIVQIFGFEMLFVAFTVGWTIYFLCVRFFSLVWSFVLRPHTCTTQLNATFYV